MGHVGVTQNLPFSCCPLPSIPLLSPAVERRRRFNINDRIKELGMLIPKANDLYVPVAPAALGSLGAPRCWRRGGGTAGTQVHLFSHPG